MKVNRQVKTVIGYVRSATVNQNGESDSLETQEKQIKNYCKEKGVEITGVFIDSNKSGANLERPALNQMLELINRGKVNNVICTDRSRLSRNMQDYLKLNKVIKRRGVAVKFIHNRPLVDVFFGLFKKAINKIRLLGKKDGKQYKYLVYSRISSPREVWVK